MHFLSGTPKENNQTQKVRLGNNYVKHDDPREPAALSYHLKQNANHANEDRKKNCCTVVPGCRIQTRAVWWKCLFSNEMAVILQNVLHVLIGLLLAGTIYAPLLLLLGCCDLIELGILAGGLLADGCQSTNHIVHIGQFDLLPHDSELGVHGVEETGLVQPNVRRAAVFAGPDHQYLVRRLELVNGLVAVRPAVLQILDFEFAGIRLALQVVEQRCLALDAGNLGSEFVPTRLPCRNALLLQLLDPGSRVGQERDLSVLAQTLCELLVKTLLGVLQGEMVEDLLQILGRALGLEEFYGIELLRPVVGTKADNRGGNGRWSRGRGRSISRAVLALLLLGRCSAVRSI